MTSARLEAEARAGVAQAGCRAGRESAGAVRKAKLALGSFFLMPASGQLYAACLAHCNFRPLKKNRFSFFAWSWEVREPEISCAGALCRLASGDFPFCLVAFGATTEG